MCIKPLETREKNGKMPSNCTKWPEVFVFPVKKAFSVNMRCQ